METTSLPPRRSLRFCSELLIYGALASVYNATEFPLLLTCLPTTLSLQLIDLITFFYLQFKQYVDDFQNIR